MTSTYKHELIFFRISAQIDSAPVAALLIVQQCVALFWRILLRTSPVSLPVSMMPSALPFPEAAPEHFLMASRVPEQPAQAVLVTLAFTAVTAVTPRHSPISAA